MTTLSPEKILYAGYQALGSQKYRDAIKLLENYLTLSIEQNSDYYQAKRLLVKAYQGAEEIDRALALCYDLQKNGDGVAQIWANNYIVNLAPIDESETIPSVSQSDISEKPIKVFHYRSLRDFKTFFQTNLVKDLKEIETVRQTAHKSVAVALAIALLLTFFVAKGVYSYYKATETPPEFVGDSSKACLEKFSCYTENLRLQKNHEEKKRETLAFQKERSKIVILSLMMFAVILFFWIAFTTSVSDTYSRQFKLKITKKILNFVDPSKSLKYAWKNDGSGAIDSFSHSMMVPMADRAMMCIEKDYTSGRIGSTHIIFSQINIGVDKTFGLRNFDLTRRIDLTLRHHGPTVELLVLLIIAKTIKMVRGILVLIAAAIKTRKLDFEFFDRQMINPGPNIESIFKGIFFRAQFNKFVMTRVTIVPNSLKAILPPRRDWGSPVKLEDPLFNKLFTVYSQDQVAARYALSTALIDRLVTFQRKANRPVYLSIVDDRIYVGLKGDREYLEPSLLRPMTHFNPIRDYFETLQLLLGIVDDLNLNQRIWMR